MCESLADIFSRLADVAHDLLGVDADVEPGAGADPQRRAEVDRDATTGRGQLRVKVDGVARSSLDPASGQLDRGIVAPPFSDARLAWAPISAAARLSLTWSLTLSERVSGWGASAPTSILTLSCLPR